MVFHLDDSFVTKLSAHLFSYIFYFYLTQRWWGKF